MALVSNPADPIWFFECHSNVPTCYSMQQPIPSMTKQVQDPQRVTELLVAAPLKDHMRKQLGG